MFNDPIQRILYTLKNDFFRDKNSLKFTFTEDKNTL